MAVSSLSAGEIIRNILVADEEISAKVSKIFPVSTDNADLPYIAYRRAKMEQTPVKAGRGADVIDVEVSCYAETYSESIELAELVRNALDGATGETDDLVMRSCYLTDSSETWRDDAYVQELNFTIKI